MGSPSLQSHCHPSRRPEPRLRGKGKRGIWVCAAPRSKLVASETHGPYTSLAALRSGQDDKEWVLRGSVTHVGLNGNRNTRSILWRHRSYGDEDADIRFWCLVRARASMRIRSDWSAVKSKKPIMICRIWLAFHRGCMIPAAEWPFEPSNR